MSESLEDRARLSLDARLEGSPAEDPKPKSEAPEFEAPELRRGSTALSLDSRLARHVLAI